MRHGWPVICLSTAWATSSRDAKRWRWSPPKGDVEATKGKLDGRLGSGTLGIREAPTPVTRDLECLAQGHAAPNAETGPSGLRAAVFHEGRQQDDCEDDPNGLPGFFDGHEFCSRICLGANRMVPLFARCLTLRTVIRSSTGAALMADTVN